MANATTKPETATTKPETAKVKKRGKKLELRVPFVKLEEGMVISGTIVMFTVQESTTYGDRNVVQIRLDEPLSWPPSKKAKEQTRGSAKVDDVVAVEIKAGMSAIKNLAEGTDVTIEVLGKVDTGKAEPAWTFDITFE